MRAAPRTFVAALRQLSVLSALWALCTAAPVAQEPAAEAGLLGTARTIDGRALEGTLTVVDDRAKVTTAAGVVELPLGELLAFESRDATRRPVDAPHRVWLRSGDELPARRLSGAPFPDAASPTAPSTEAATQRAELFVELPSGVVVALPLATLRALRRGGAALTPPPSFQRDLLDPPKNEDALHVDAQGRRQRSLVTVTAFSADRVHFLLRGDEYDFELDGTEAIVFGANTGFAPDRQPRPRTTVELTTGERLDGRLLRVDDVVTCRLDEGAVVTVPRTKVAALRFQSDRLVWLSELTPTVEQVPAFDRVWPWTIDHTALGPGFVLDGRTFERGLGLVPRTTLTFDLGGRFDRFEAVLGIDDRSGPDAHAVVRVVVDGRIVHEAAAMTRDAAAEALRIDVTGARSLVLEADFGKNYDLGDHCVFADARLLQR